MCGVASSHEEHHLARGTRSTDYGATSTKLVVGITPCHPGADDAEHAPVTEQQCRRARRLRTTAMLRRA